MLYYSKIPGLVVGWLLLHLRSLDLSLRMALRCLFGYITTDDTTDEWNWSSKNLGFGVGYMACTTSQLGSSFVFVSFVHLPSTFGRVLNIN